MKRIIFIFTFLTSTFLANSAQAQLRPPLTIQMGAARVKVLAGDIHSQDTPVIFPTVLDVLGGHPDEDFDFQSIALGVRRALSQASKSEITSVSFSTLGSNERERHVSFEDSFAAIITGIQLYSLDGDLHPVEDIRIVAAGFDNTESRRFVRDYVLPIFKDADFLRRAERHGMEFPPLQRDGILDQYLNHDVLTLRMNMPNVAGRFYFACADLLLAHQQDL